MDIITLLERLANSTHSIDIDEFISSQPIEIQQAFLSKNTADLKALLGSTENLADKSIVVQITSR